MANADLSPEDEQALYRTLADRETAINSTRRQAAANPGLAAAATAIHTAAPDAAAGVKYALVQAVSSGMVSMNDAIDKAMIAGLRQPSWGERLLGTLNPITDVKGIVRTGLGVVGSGAQAFQSSILANNPSRIAEARLGQGHTGGFESDMLNTNQPAAPLPSLKDLALSTTAGQDVASLAKTGTLQSGAGFFPAGPEEQARKAPERAIRGTVPFSEQIDPQTGQPIPGTAQTRTVGRVLASTYTEPGSHGYRVLSGMTDAAVAWYGDPGNFALDALAKARQAHSTISAVKALEDSDIAKALRPGEKIVKRAGEQGVMRDGAFTPMSDINAEARAIRRAEGGVVEGYTRGTIHGPTAEEFLQTKKGQAVAASIAADGDWASIHKALGSQVAPAVVTRLRDAKTSAEVNEILYDVLGTSVKSTRQIRPTAAQSWWEAPGYAARDFRQGHRSLQQMPEMHLGTSYKMTELEQIQAVNNMDRTLANAKVPWGTRSKIVGEWGSSLGNSAQDRFTAIKNAQRAVEQSLLAYGTDPGLAKTLTTFADSEIVRIYGMNAHGVSTDFSMIAPGAKTVEGELLLDDELTQHIRSIGPQLLTEGLGSAISLPNPRQIRRLTSKLGRVTSSTNLIDGEKVLTGHLRPSIAHIETLQSMIWKPLAIIRPAFLVRVIGDEQMRMAANNQASLFRHPFEWISYAMHNSGSFDALGQDFTRLEAHAASAGDWDAYNAALHRGFGRGSAKYYVDPLGVEERARITGSYATVDKAQHAPLWETGVQEEWRQIHHDPIGSRVASGQTNEELVSYLNSKAGKADYDHLVTRGKSGLPGINTLTNDTVRVYRDYTDPAQLDDWLNSVRRRLQDKAGGDQEILDAIGSGRIGQEEMTMSNAEIKALEPIKDGAGPRVVDPFTGKASTWVGTKFKLADDRIITVMNDADKAGHSIVATGAAAWDEAGRPSAHLKAATKRFRESDASPQKVKYSVRGKDKLDGFAGEAAAVSKQARDRVVNGFFSGLYGRASDWLSRSPAFRQSYWQRVTDLAENLSPDEANLFLKRMQGAADKYHDGDVAALLGSDKAVGSAVERAGRANGSLTLEDLDQYAKGHALDQTNKLLYDAARRNNFFDIGRIIFPFGEAWKEVLQSWGRIIINNPRVVRRAQMLVQGARGFDPDGDGQGFFHVDETTGQEVYTYPFSRQVSRFLTGTNPVTSTLDHIPVLGRFVAPGAPAVSMDLNGSVQGLNIGMSPVPSLGLVAQVPVSMIVHDKPYLDFIKKVLLPYGETDLSAGSAIPAWAKKIGGGLFDKPESNRIYGDTFMRVVQALAASGKYGTTTDEQDRLRRDATQQARVLTIFRGVVQSSGPSSPSIDFAITTKDGNNFLASQLIKEYQRLRQEDPNTALEKFQGLYGEMAATAYATSRTRTQQGGLEASTAFGEFERKNRAAFQSHPDVAGYMGPTGTEFDFAVYDRQLASGARKKLSSSEYLSAVNETIVNQNYYAVRDALAAKNAATGSKMTQEQRQWLADFKAKMFKAYPVNDPDPSAFGDLPTTIRHLDDLVNSKAMANNDVAATTKDYLLVRNAALAKANDRGQASLSGAKMADIREVLFQMGQDMSKENPQFGRLWNRVLSREVDS